jgi:hypothetical protein
VGCAALWGVLRCGVCCAVGCAVLWGVLCCWVCCAVGCAALWGVLCCRVCCAVGCAALWGVLRCGVCCAVGCAALWGVLFSLTHAAGPRVDFEQQRVALATHETYQQHKWAQLEAAASHSKLSNKMSGLRLVCWLHPAFLGLRLVCWLHPAFLGLRLVCCAFLRLNLVCCMHPAFQPPTCCPFNTLGGRCVSYSHGCCH